MVDSTMKNLFAAIVLASAVVLTGCATTGVEQREQLVGYLDAAESELARLESRLAAVQEALATGSDLLRILPDEWAQRVLDGTQKPIEAALEYAAWLMENRDDLLARTQSLRNRIEGIPAEGVDAGLVWAISGAEAAGTFGNLLPPPWGTIISAVGVGLAGVLGAVARNKSKQVIEVVSAIEAGKTDAKYPGTFIVDKAKAKAEMSPATRKAVERIRAGV